MPCSRVAVFFVLNWRLLPSHSQILTLSDSGAAWSKQLGLTIDLSAAGMGLRTGRYAMILDDLVVKYLGVRL
jgi:alkyl hydroperoxide reductase 1